MTSYIRRVGCGRFRTCPLWNNATNSAEIESASKRNRIQYPGCVTGLAAIVSSGGGVSSRGLCRGRDCALTHGPVDEFTYSKFTAPTEPRILCTATQLVLHLLGTRLGAHSGNCEINLTSNENIPGSSRFLRLGNLPFSKYSQVIRMKRRNIGEQTRCVA